MKKNLNCEESDNRKKKNLSKKNKRLLPSLIFFSSLFLLNISISFAWTGPPGDPPTCPVGAVGCSYLLNTGATAQTKTGGINLATTSGSVGIGTSSPGYKLDVSGTARFTGALTGLSAIFSSTVSVGTPTASTHAVTKAYVDTAITNSSSKWTTSGTNTYLTTTTNNVGIGTTSPEQKLDVAGNVRIVSGDLIFNHYSTNRNVIDIYGGDGNGIGIAFGGGGRTIVGSGESASVASTQLAGTTEQLNLVSDTNMVFTTNLQSGWATRVDSMYIAASGNVGIGQASPSYKLDVSGTGRFTGAVIVGTPTESGHATTKSYVDSSISNASSKWTVSGSNTYLTTTTNNVGIGTTSPTSKLHVAGKAQVTDGVATADTQNYASFGVTREASASSLAYIAMTKSATTVRAMGIDGSNNWVFGAPTITTQIISSPWMVISSSGSIGIGNTAPGYKLDVSGTGRFTGSVIVGEPTISTHAATKGYVDSAVAGTTQGTVTSVGTGSGLTGGPITSSGTISVDSTVIRTTGNQTLGGTKTFSSPVIVATPTGSTHATTKAYVDSAVSNAASKWSLDGSNIYRQYNNVGIGTTSPVAKLEVRQDMTSYDTSFTAPHLRLSTTNTVDYTGFVGVTYAGSTSNNYGWSVGALRSTNGLSSFIWKHHDNSVAGTEYMRITNTGNVGIGTINPIAKNHIVSSVTTSEILQVIGSGLTANAYTGIGFQGYIAGNAAIKSGILHQRILSYGVGSLMFAVNGVQDNSNISLSDVKMTINSSGDIGINDTTPSYKLDVNGTGRFTGTVSVATPTASNHATTKAYVDSMFSGSGPWTLSGSNVYVTNTANNVGIGNTSPTSKLHVTGDIASSSGYLKLSDGYGINWANGSGSIATTGSSSYSILFKTYNGSANTEKMRITGYGNVGIGNTDPVEKLDVNGAIRVSGVRENGGSAAGFLSYESGGILTLMGNGPDATTVGQIQLSVRETDGGNLKDVLRINSVGDVGINDTTPSYKLDVNGTGRFTGTLTGAAATFSSTVGVGTPTASTHATTKAYVDSAISGAASKWTTSGNNIYNNNSGNVGIGIASPSAKLNISEATGTVHGAAQGSFIIDHENSGGASSIVFRSKVNRGSDYGYIQYQDTDTVGGVGETARLIIGTSNDFNDHIILQPAGSVGIGQTSPSYKLDVSGTGRFTGTVVVGEPTASTHAVTKGYVDSAISGTTQGTVTSITAGSGLSGGTITTSGTIAVDSTVIRTTGNQTLGGTKTFSSAVVLSTAGTLTTHAVRADRSISTGSGLSGGGNLTANRTLTVDSTVIRTTGDQTLGGIKTFSSPVVVPTPTGSTHATTKAYVDSAVSNASSKWTTSGSNTYLTTTTNNLGIGTTSPSAKIHISKTSVANKIPDTYSAFILEDTESRLQLISPNTGNYASSILLSNVQASGDQRSWVLMNRGIDASNSFQIGYRQSAVSETIVDNSSKLLTITTAGNVGIGQTAPSYKLDVSGTGRFTGTLTGAAATFSGTVGVATPTASTHATTKAYVDSLVAANPSGTVTSITAGSGLSGGTITTSGTIAVDSTVIRTTGNQTLGGTKTFSSAVVLSTAGTLTTHAVRADRSISTGSGLSGGGNLTANRTLTVDSTVIRTTGDQTLGGIKTFSSPVVVPTPTGSTHATTKAYVDSMFSGSGPWTLSGSNVYVTNTSHNVGIGTTSPSYKLDINGSVNLASSLNIAGKAILSLPSNNPETGPWNPIWNAIGSSKPLYFDEEFASGANNVGVYNNAGGTAVTVTRLTGQTGIPNSTGSVLKVSYDGVGSTSPGYGGVVLIFNSSANKTYVQRFRAKLPVGRNFVLAENAQGDNSTSYWLTNTAGTGKWEDYMRVSHTGNTGSFSSSGHIYVTGGTGAFDWYIASMNIYEVNVPIIASANTWVSQQTFNGGTRFPGSGIWNTSGNVGINDTTPDYKLDVNGTGRFTGTLTGAAATFSGTVGVATPTASTHATTKAYVDSLVAANPSGTVTSITAGSGLSGGTITTSGTIAVDSTVIRTTGNQTLGGTKTFSSAVVLSTAGTLTTHAVRADRSISTGSGLSGGGNLTANRTLTVDSTVIRTTGDQTLGGIKTFSSPVVVPTPTGSTHATTKAYVDSMFSGSGPWTLSGSNVYVTNTSHNVGIGTTSPSQKLEINNNSLLSSYPLLLSNNYGTSTDVASVGIKFGRTNDQSWGAVIGSQQLSGSYSGGMLMFQTETSDALGLVTKMAIDKDGNVGIGTTGPGYKLDVRGDVSINANTSGAALSPIFTAGNTGKSYLHFPAISGSNDPGFIMHETSALTADNNKGVIHISPTDDNDNANDYVAIHGTNDPETIKLYTGGNIYTSGILQVAGTSNSYLMGNFGIGTTSPGYKLDVNGTGRFSGSLTGTSATFSGTVGVATPTASTHATTKAYVDGGFLKNTGDVTLTGNLNMATYKLTVGTIDPLFNINGKSYATYAPSMTGVKEESTGVIKMGEANCEEEGNSILCNYEIKFDEQKDGSDLWIFRKVTDFGDEWKNLEIILTPNFNGSVWYKKIPGENKILVSANINSLNNSDDFEISYRFTAARFDHEEWSNTPEGVNPEAGFIIK